MCVVEKAKSLAADAASPLRKRGVGEISQLTVSTTDLGNL